MSCKEFLVPSPRHFFHGDSTKNIKALARPENIVIWFLCLPRFALIYVQFKLTYIHNHIFYYSEKLWVIKEKLLKSDSRRRCITSSCYLSLELKIDL